MKRLIALLCVIPLTAALLAGCMQKTSELKDDTATIASEVKDNFDDMVDNGTVNDGDGFIDENKDNDRSRDDMTRSTEYVTEVTEYDDRMMESEEYAPDASEFI